MERGRFILSDTVREIRFYSDKRKGCRNKRRLIRQNSRISAKELAESLGISSRQCEWIIAELKEQGLLERKGSKKTGFWEVK